MWDMSVFWCCGIRGRTREEAVVRMHGLDSAIHWIARERFACENVITTENLSNAVHAAWFLE